MKKIYFCLPLLFSVIFADSVSVKVNDFGTEFYQKSLSDGNLCFSPYSLFHCLSTAYLGSENTTRQEMASVLHITESKEEFSHLLSSFTEDVQSEDFQRADAVWLGKNTVLTNTYQTLVKDLDVELQNLNFSDPGQSADIINNWVFGKTNGMIPRLLSASDLDSRTKAVLTNAVRFQSNWLTPFPEHLTIPKAFHVSDQESVSVLMMRQTEHLPYYEDEECSLLILPVLSSNARYGCFFLLPKTPSAPLSLQTLVNKIKQTQETFVAVELPKFRLQHRLDAKALLQDLGMQSAFSLEADFSSLCEKTDFYIDKVIHEACFTVDENGVEAAAATAIIEVESHAIRAPRIPVPFIADKPFIFGIVDLNSDLVLFLGKLTRP